MRKSYLTEEQITYFVKRGQEIMSPSDIKKAKAIAAKYSFELTGSKQSNMQLYWNAIKEQIEALPVSDPFRNNLQQLRTWQYRDTDSIITVDYMKYKKLYESEFMLLASPRWDELYTYIVCDLSYAGVSSDGGIGIFINNSGDYYGYISKYAKEYADPESIKTTTNLMNTLDGLMAGLTYMERGTLASVVNQYLNALDKPLDFDTLHNLLNKNK